MLLLISSLSYSQEVKTDSVKLYTLEDLAPKGKLSLTKIYLDQVALLSSILPNTAFSQINDIPDNSFTRDKWKHINKSSYRRSKVITETYKDLIPYADKRDIIDSIMYLQEVILVLQSIN